MDNLLKFLQSFLLGFMIGIMLGVIFIELSDAATIKEVVDMHNKKHCVEILIIEDGNLKHTIDLGQCDD
jgi:hypothetical protein